MYPRKLSVLTSEELNIEIQQKHSQTPPLTEESDDANNAIKNASAVGHSSVEDAAAALRLYWHKSGDWERFLGHPLRRTRRRLGPSWRPLEMYLDGCNLPMGMRGANFKELMASNPDEVGRIPSASFRLTSRKRDSHRSSNISVIDWIPIFQSALSSRSVPKLDSISVMFDGAKFGSIKSGSRKGKAARAGSLETRVFRLDSSDGTPGPGRDGSIRIEITADGDSADDVLFHRCSAESADASSPAFDPGAVRRTMSLGEVADAFSGNDDEADALSGYVVVRRKSGGKKTHRRLFDRLHLRRPDEGALCLSAMTPGLRRQSLRIARELRRERGVERVIECEWRARGELRFAVVTDDVYLTDRLVKEGVLVLSYNQLTNMF